MNGANNKIEQKISKLTMKLSTTFNKKLPKTPGVTIYHTSGKTRFIYNSQVSLVDIYINMREFITKLPIQRENEIKSLIIKIVQNMYYGNNKDKSDYLFLERFYSWEITE